MDDILEKVKLYDTKTLREKLLENGIKVGPIPPTSISLFQRRLAKHLFLKEGGTLEDDDGPVASTTTLSLQNESPTPAKTVTNCISNVFYAICVPQDVELDTVPDGGQLVFNDKEKAFKLAKKIKGSRFKVFKSEIDALQFTKLSSESVFQSPRRPSKEDTVDPPVSLPSTESSVYKAPRPQELAILRKVIEADKVKLFVDQVWNNPRYLVSSGDTPSIFQEGPRYTAMHVAAIKNKPEICQAILDILEDPHFVRKLYGQGKNTEETLNSRINFLVDLYLNMPDKGSCESPLHMACKFGYDRVVEILAAHPRTDKLLKNKWGDTPKDLICSRCTSPSLYQKQRITSFLQGQCYVPLIRSDDNTSAPVIGQPWSPDLGKSPLEQVSRVASSPRDPTMSVKACAGPMSPTDAGIFHKRWTTPPSQSQQDKAREYFHTKRSDSEKGMERIGRALATELHVQWKEYWEFLDQFLDISSTDGLDTLERYLQKRIWLQFSKAFKDKHCIVDETLDMAGFSTPLVNRIRSATANTGASDECIKSLDSVFEKETSFSTHCGNDQDKSKIEAGRNAVSKLDSKDQDKSKNETDGNAVSKLVSKTPDKSTNEADADVTLQSDECLSPAISANVSDIVSPMTNLTQTFAKLNFLDKSMSSDKESLSPEKGNMSSEKGNMSSDKGTMSSDKGNISSDKGNISSEKETAGSSVQAERDNDTDKKPDNSDVPENKVLNVTKGTSEGENIPENGGPPECETAEVAKKETNTDTAKTEQDEPNGSAIPAGDTEKGAKTDQNEANGSVISAEDTEKGAEIDQNGNQQNTVLNAVSNTENNKPEGCETELLHNDKIQDVSVSSNIPDSECKQSSSVQRLRSTSSGSSGSFQTALDGSGASSLSYCSQVSDPGDTTVCVRIRNSAIFKQLLDHVLNKNTDIQGGASRTSPSDQACGFGGSGGPVCFILQWKPYSTRIGQKVTIVSCTEDYANNMFLIEDIDVASYDGDLSKLQEGEMIEIADAGTDANSSKEILTAYMTLAETLPKCGFIHGPQPTREDLDVNRGLGNTLIIPGQYPNVFHWKLSLAKFLKDTNYKWQSPAKPKSRRQASPQSTSALGMNSPAIPYGSPLGLEVPAARNNYVTSNIRTKLFPSIFE